MEIIKNSLRTNHKLGILKLEDENYLIKIYYLGDYEKEIETGLDLTYLSASIKPKKYIPNLEVYFRDKEVLMNLQDIGYIRDCEIDLLMEKINLARNEAKILQKYLEEYFYPYY